jgi:transcriptional regulator with XRE-family HTH domain
MPAKVSEFETDRNRQKFLVQTTTVSVRDSMVRAMDRIGPRTPVRWYLREWRTARGWTLEQLGERMDANKSQIQKLETGKTKWDAGWLARAAFAFGCEPNDLLYPPDRPSPSELLRGLSVEETEKVIDLAKAVTKKAS